jgi:small-conductance mechanosensitive channel
MALDMFENYTEVITSNSTGIITLDQLLLNEYFIALMIIIGSLVATQVFKFILRLYVKRVSSRTKTDLDDRLVEAITKPGYLLIIFAGLYLAFRRISMFDPHAILVDNAFFVIIAFTAAYMVSRIFSVLISHWLHVQKKYEQTPKLISKIVAVVFYLIAGMVILAYFKIEITPIIATLGLGGLAVGLALQDTLSNFFAGLHILTDKPVSVGDFVELENGAITGTVEDISWRTTRIRTISNTLVIVPNAKLANSTIVNDSLPNQETEITIQCGVSYASNLNKVEKVTLDVAKKIQQDVTGAVKGFEPTVRYHTFGDSNINFSVTLRLQTIGDRFRVRHEFIKALKERYDREGIEISWPVRKLYYGEKQKSKKR